MSGRDNTGVKKPSPETPLLNPSLVVTTGAPTFQKKLTRAIRNTPPESLIAGSLSFALSWSMIVYPLLVMSAAQNRASHEGKPVNGMDYVYASSSFSVNFIQTLVFGFLGLQPSLSFLRKFKNSPASRPSGSELAVIAARGAVVTATANVGGYWLLALAKFAGIRSLPAAIYFSTGVTLLGIASVDSLLFEKILPLILKEFVEPLILLLPEFSWRNSLIVRLAQSELADHVKHRTKEVALKKFLSAEFSQIQADEAMTIPQILSEEAEEGVSSFSSFLHWVFLLSYFLPMFASNMGNYDNNVDQDHSPGHVQGWITTFVGIAILVFMSRDMGWDSANFVMRLWHEPRKTLKNSWADIILVPTIIALTSWLTAGPSLATLAANGQVTDAGRKFLRPATAVGTGIANAFGLLTVIQRGREWFAHHDETSPSHRKLRRDASVQDLVANSPRKPKKFFEDLRGVTSSLKALSQRQRDLVQRGSDMSYADLDLYGDLSDARGVVVWNLCLPLLTGLLYWLGNFVDLENVPLETFVRGAILASSGTLAAVVNRSSASASGGIGRSDFFRKCTAVGKEAGKVIAVPVIAECARVVGAWSAENILGFHDGQKEMLAFVMGLLAAAGSSQACFSQESPISRAIGLGR